MSNLTSRRALLFVLLMSAVPTFAADSDFVGTWKLNPEKSGTRMQPRTPSRKLVVHQRGTGSTLVFDVQGTEPALVLHMTLDGNETRDKNDGGTISTFTKWEGSALLLNCFVDERTRTYTMMDRWSITNAGRTLEIHRTTVDRKGSVENTLVYDRE